MSTFEGSTPLSPPSPTGEPRFPVTSTTPGILKLPNQESRSITPISETASPAPLPESTSPGPSDLVSKSTRKIVPAKSPLSQEEPSQKTEKVAQRVLMPPEAGVEEQQAPSTGVSPAPEAPSPDIEEESPEEEHRQSVENLVDFGVPEPIAERLIDGYEAKWEGFANEAEGWKQVHGVAGLKVYMDPATGGVVADYGLGTLGGGQYKRSKAMIRFNEDGTLSYHVRYTSLKKDAPSTEEREIFRQRFHRDIHRELDMREYARKAGDGAPVPNLLEITPIPYVNDKGEPKIRYVAQRGLGTIYSLVFNRETGEPLPVEERKTRRALLGAEDGLKAVVELHRRNIVHRDIRGENILFLEDEDEKPEGRLSDLGLAVRLPQRDFMGDPYTPGGTPAYTAPEVILGTATRYDPSMDMYPFGIILLELVHPERAAELQELQGSLLIANAKGERNVTIQGKYTKTFDEVVDVYIKTLATIQEQLRSTGNPLDSLTANLIEYDPGMRPTSAQALPVLSACLHPTNGVSTSHSANGASTSHPAK